RGGNNLVNVLATTSSLRVNTARSDTVHLGNARAGVQDLQGPVAINNQLAGTTLIVDDGADSRARTGTLSASDAGGLITGLAPATITYASQALNSLRVTAGSANDSLLVPSTLAGFPITLDSSGGSDTITVGNAQHGVQDIRGPLTVLNSQGF